MGRFHRLPQLDHPNLIQRKAISGGCPGPGREHTPARPTPQQGSKEPRQDEGEQVRRAAGGSAPTHAPVLTAVS